MILKTYIYSSLISKNPTHSLFTQNKYNNNYKQLIFLKKKPIYLYQIFKENNIFKFKEISGTLIKHTKKNNLNNIHLIQLKKYNNNYITMYIESPNIIN